MVNQVSFKLKHKSKIIQSKYVFSTEIYNLTFGVLITILAVSGTASNILSGMIYCKTELRNHYIGMVQISLKTRSSLFIGKALLQ